MRKKTRGGCPPRAKSATTLRRRTAHSRHRGIAQGILCTKKDGPAGGAPDRPGGRNALPIARLSEPVKRFLRLADACECAKIPHHGGTLLPGTCMGTGMEAQSLGHLKEDGFHINGGVGQNADIVDIPAAERPCVRVHWRPWRAAGDDTEPREPGVWAHRIDRRTQATYDEWVSDPIDVVGLSRAAEPGAQPEAGIVLQWRDCDGRSRIWPAPASIMAGRAENLETALLDAGCRIAIWPVLRAWLAGRTRAAHVIARHAVRSGWGADRTYFVAGSDIYVGSGERNTVVRLSGSPPPQEKSNRRGSLQDWRTDVAAAAATNPLMAISISASLAAPIIELLGLDSGGIHFCGHSSAGKTTLLHIAASVWGIDVDTWSATVAGLEILATSRNDLPVILDEIGVARPQTVADITYYVLLGSPKARATITLDAMKRPKWRTLLLSSGEKQLSPYLGEELRAGHKVRLVDIDVGDSVIEDYSPYHSPAAAIDGIRAAAVANTGWAGPALIAYLLTSDGAEDARRQWAMTRAALEPIAASVGGQAARVVGRLAAVAAAGEIAVTIGILPWPAGWATSAVARVLRESVAQTIENTGIDAAEKLSSIEDRQIIERLVTWISKNEGQFSPRADTETTVRERAGWWSDQKEQRVYYVLWNRLTEIVPGWPAVKIAEAVERAGMLAEHDKDLKRKTLWVSGRVVRTLALTLDAGDHGGMVG